MLHLFLFTTIYVQLVFVVLKAYVFLCGLLHNSCEILDGFVHNQFVVGPSRCSLNGAEMRTRYLSLPFQFMLLEGMPFLLSSFSWQQRGISNFNKMILAWLR